MIYFKNVYSAVMVLMLMLTIVDTIAAPKSDSLQVIIWP